MRIALFNGSLPPTTATGVGYQVDLLARGLVDRGHDATIFTTADVGGGRPYELRRLSRPGLGPFGWLLGNGAAFARAPLDGFDVAHAHGDSWGIRDRPVVRTYHGTGLDEALNAASAKRRVAQGTHYLSELVQSVRATVTTAVSRDTARRIPHIDHVIPNAVDNEVFHPGGERFRRPTILMVAGHLGGRKRGHLLLEAFAQVRDVVPGVRLIIVTKDEVRMADVEVRSSISQEEIGELFRRSWVLCSTSSYEGFGLPYIEAMASGLPIVTTANAGAREILSPAAGMIVEVPFLATGLVRMLTEAETAEGYRQRGFEAARAYSLDVVLDQYVDAYRAAMAA